MAIFCPSQFGTARMALACLVTRRMALSDANQARSFL
jgi:hypothetical protein